MKMLLVSILLSLGFYLQSFGQCTKGDCDTGKGMYSYPDGGYYKGEWVNGLRHGQGEYHMSNGDQYSGEWKKNLMHGQGTYSYSNGEQYEGQFVKDEIEGQGVYTFSDGGFYEGEWKGGRQHGTGILTYSNGSQITSDGWDQGKINGNAKYLYSDGSSYEGAFENGTRNGYGKYLNNRGDLYEGEWRSGRKYGKGRMTFATGMVYDGDWKDGRMSGTGRLTTPSGSDYQGEFFNGKYNGFGILHFNNGDRYEGNWMNGKMHGQGKYEYGDGSVYEGEWVMDMRHGQGTYASVDGTVYFYGNNENVWTNSLTLKDNYLKVYYRETNQLPSGIWDLYFTLGNNFILPRKLYNPLPLPKFPWPPPKSSAMEVVDRKIFSNCNKLVDIDIKLQGALNASGYTEISYHSVPNGFALVCRLEQINKDGTPKVPGRWDTGFSRRSAFSLTRIIEVLFQSNPGYYRTVVFIVSDQPFNQSDYNASRVQVSGWLTQGLNVLPGEIGESIFSNKYAITALIYEFELPESGEKAHFVDPGRFTGQTHLEQSNIWNFLNE